MQKRKFGRTGLAVSEVGFGAWAIGGGAVVGTTAIGWGDGDDSVSKQAIHAALDAGINFFDTADIYGLGHSETLLGEALHSQHDVIVATKVGNVARNGQFTVDYDPQYIREACEASLRRLRREAIDYYQLHSARLPHLQSGECIEAMQDLQREGKIRHWGLSLNTFDPEPEARYLLQHELGAGLQLVLNLLNQRALPLLAEAAAKGYGIIARMPLQFGLLTGKFDAGPVFADNDHRKNRLPPNLVQQSREALAPVWALCEKYGCSKTELALGYVLSYTEISTVIPGLRTAQQVTQNTAPVPRLSADDKAMIEGLGRTALVPLLETLRGLG